MGGLELQRLSGHTAEQAETHNIDLPDWINPDIALMDPQTFSVKPLMAELG